MLKFIGALSSFNTGPNRLRLTEDEPQFVNWITGDPSYKDWKEKRRPIILHLRGPPGSGTTMTARHILRALWRSRRATNAIVVSFSFNRQDSEARTVSSLLISICRQVLLARPKLFPNIMSLGDFLLRQKVFTERTLWSVLHSLLLHLSGTEFYCVIHSVHDCESLDKVDRILREMSKVALKSPDRLKILITSYDSYSFTAAAEIYQEIRLDENAQIGAAIENTVRAHLRALPREIPISAHLEDEIVRISTRNKNYLLATRKLEIMKTLTTLSTEKAMREAFSKLPKTLGDSHTYLIGENRSNWVRTALISITHASRPLTPAELSIIVALDKYDDTSISTLTENLSNNIFGDLIRSVGSFVKLVDGRILPFHRSMWDLLRKTTAKMGDDLHAFLLEKCLRYLNLRKRHKAEISSGVGPNVLDSLSQYATVHWPDHFTRTHGKKARSRAIKDIYKFLSDDTNAAAWANDYNHYVGPISIPRIALDSHLKIICYFGLADKLLTMSIRQAKSDPDFETEAQRAFDLAAGEGHKQSVSTLLRDNISSRDAMGRAAAGGHLPVIRELIEEWNFDPSLFDTEGYTPLHHASCAGHENVFKYLLEYWKDYPSHREIDGVKGLIKRNIEKRTPLDGYTPLHLATRTGQLGIIRRLVEAEADIAAEDQEGRSALHLAAQAGFTDVLEFLLEQERINPEKADRNADTALHLAVEFGHPSTVKILLKYSQNCHRPNNAQATPVHLAAKKGYLDILQLLCEEVARLDSNYDAERQEHSDRSHVGQTGQNQIEMENSKINADKVPKLYFNPSHVFTPFQLAAQEGHIDIVKFLIHDGFNLGNHEDTDRGFALFLAAKQGHSAIVGILLDGGVGTMVTDELGNTPLHVAAEGGHYSVIETLVKDCKTYGINDVNHDGWTPLHKAAHHGSLRLVKFLVEEGARIESVTKEDIETPLKIAARQGHPKVAGYLFEKALKRKKRIRCLRSLVRRKTNRPGPDQEMENGRTAFDIAVLNGYPSVAEALIQGRLELELPRQLQSLLKYASVLKEMREPWDPKAAYGKGSQKSTPLHFAVRKGYASSVEYLLGKLDDIHTRDGRGRTPLQMAALRNNPGICKIILSYCANQDRWPLDKQQGCAASDDSENSATRTDEESSEGRDPTTVSATSTPLFLACYYAKEKAVEAILDWFKDKRDPDIQRHLHLDESDEDIGWTPLHAAADNAKITSMLLRAGANPNCLTANTKATPLAMAAYPNDCLDVVKVLLEHPKCDRNPQDSDGDTPVHRAVTGGNLAIVKELASKNAQLDISRQDGCTPLHLAAATGQTEIFMFLADSEVRVDTKSEKYGTSLIAAVIGERLEVVERLLEERVDVNATGGPHHTPLQAAARYGNLAIIEKLLEYHSRINDPDDPLHNPLVAAIDGGKEEAALLLCKKDANLDTGDEHGNSLLQLVAKMGSVKMLDYLLRERPEIDLDCRRGLMDTPLCTSIIYGHEEIALRLLQTNANVDLQSNDGRSPLYLAVSGSKSAIVAKLVEKGAYDPVALEKAVSLGYDDLVRYIRRNAHNFDPHDRAPVGDSWLWLTVLSGRVEVLDALLENAELSPQDKNGKYFLLLAVSRQDVDMVTSLLRLRNAHIIERDLSNRTALILDVLHGASCLTTLLRDLKERMDTREIDVRDSTGKTALIHACMKSDTEAVMKLLDSGADPSITDSRKCGPLYWACRRHSEPIFDLIVQKFDEGKNYTEQYGNALFGAIASNEPSLIQKLVATKLIPPTVQDNDGWTPVETARRYGLNSIESRLLEAGFSDETTQMPHCDEQLGWSTEEHQDALAVKDRVSVVVEESKYCVSPVLLNKRDSQTA